MSGSQNVNHVWKAAHLTNQPQQPTGISFQMDNMTFSHHMASVNGIQLHYVIGGHGVCCCRPIEYTTQLVKLFVKPMEYLDRS